MWFTYWVCTQSADRREYATLVKQTFLLAFSSIIFTCTGKDQIPEGRTFKRCSFCKDSKSEMFSLQIQASHWILGFLHKFLGVPECVRVFSRFTSLRTLLQFQISNLYQPVSCLTCTHSNDWLWPNKHVTEGRHQINEHYIIKDQRPQHRKSGISEFFLHFFLHCDMSYILFLCSHDWQPLVPPPWQPLLVCKVPYK